MEEKEVVKIVISNGDYREIYEPLSRDPKEADDKIKRSILSKKGMSEEEIESIIDQIDVESEPGVDGNFDDGPYTPIVLVRNIRREPEDVTLDAPVLEEQNQKSEQEPRQVMLKQYYGDRQAEKQRRETFSRFKSNIIQKPMKIYDKDGKQKVMNIYTIRDYYGKSQDSNELLLDGYQTRLEKLSRAHQRDFSPYERQLNSLKVDALKEIMEKYKEMHKVNQKEADEFKDYAMNEIGMLENEEFRKKAIQALIDQDTEFIETNNYGYNTFQNTSKNLEN